MSEIYGIFFDKKNYKYLDYSAFIKVEKGLFDYINTKEPMDKAGSYGIQAYGSKFIKEVNGDYFTIVGLPIAKLYKRLKAL